MSIIYHDACFLHAAAELEQLPQDSGREVAFAGRSNAGKSSALNALTQQKLARTSKTPGRTQLIVSFDLGNNCRLIDLPGYGFAKVPMAVKQRWQNTLSRYLHERESLTGLVLLMDSRHPLKDLDVAMIEWAKVRNLPLHILLTKVDKLSNNEKFKVLKQVEKSLQDYPEVSVQLFSSHSREGLDILKTKLTKWYTESESL